MRTLRVEIPVAPVSQQASGLDKAALKQQIQTALQPYELFLTGEVRLNIDWMIHDRLRYETDTAPDVDNILKPTIDALCGPSGVLIDDCQIQRVNCGWIDSSDETKQALTLEIEYVEDEVIESKEIFFIQFPKGLCFPIEKDIPNRIGRQFVQILTLRLDSRKQIVDASGDYHLGLYVMPIQRFSIEHACMALRWSVMSNSWILQKNNQIPFAESKIGVSS